MFSEFFVNRFLFLFATRKEIARIDRGYMMVVASQLEAPMLHTSLVLVAHIERNRHPHLKMHPRVNICLSDCSS